MSKEIVGLGAVVLGIALAAVLGVRSAVTWLSRPTPERANQDRIVSVSPNGASDDDLNLDLAESDRTRQNGRANERQIGQANNNTDATQSLSSLEEAGSYIQRQQRVNQDSVIANTPVAVVPSAGPDAIAAQGNTRVTNQPTESVTGATNSSLSPTPSSSAVSEPVPALW